MSVLRSEVRRGAYADSIVLMQLQAALAELAGVEDAGVVMGTAANRELLAASGLLTEGLEATADDLVIVVRAESEEAATGALARVDELLARRAAETDEEFRPRSLDSAARLLPEARWVLVSVPGRWAAGVARRALDLGKNVFLYSDNVRLEDEIDLKRRAAERGLLVLGPDCGTVLVAGAGLGFANRVRRGSIGLVAASGTGLQAVASRIHALGQGVSHAFGTGGRDLSAAVGGVTARHALALLASDPGTRVVVLVSKPPAPAVAARLLAAARATGKPTVVYFQGLPRPAQEGASLFFAPGLSEAATIAASLARKIERQRPAALERESEPRPNGAAPGGSDPSAAASPGGGGCLRALFAGGTLALEAQRALAVVAGPIHSNVPILGAEPVAEAAVSRGHTILDLGADEFTVGRLHPMIDPELRLRRMRQEADDPETRLLLLDVVLGEGSHPDPAAALAPAIEEIGARRELEVVVLVVGTDEDPQDLAAQRERLEAAGAVVFDNVSEGLAHVASRLAATAPAEELPPTGAEALAEPLAALNVGLEAFHHSLVAQGARSVHVDWRPPAAGDERLARILAALDRD